MKHTAIIIEDEQPARVTLKSYLTRYYKEIDIVCEAESILEAFEFIEKNEPDIIFLDIQLKDGKGIELLDRIDSNRYKIIFTTAYSSYTFEAFQHKAFGYLVKPLDPIDFKEIIGRVINQLAAEQKNQTSGRVKIPGKNGYCWINIKDIVRCESQSNYTKIILRDNVSHLISKTLKYVEEEMLNNNSFVRVHQSHLININLVEGTKISNNNLLMVNGDKIPVSRSRKNHLFSCFKNIKS